nr:PHD finger protein 3-like [Aedes albopictus]
MSSRGRSNKGSNAGGSDSGAIGGVKVVVTDETVEPEASFPGRSCRVCRTDDSDEMVRCDRCLKWFHFSCVGVTQAIENDPWSCKDCANAEQVPEWLVNPCDGGAKKKHAAEFDSDKLNLPPLQEQDDPLTPKTSKASKVGGQAESKRNEKKAASKGRSHTSEQPPADQKQLKGANLLQSKEIDKHPTKKNNKSLARVSNQALPKETGEKPSTSFEKAKSVISHASSRASSRSSQSLAKLKLQKLEEERILNAKKLEQEQAYLEEKYRLLEEMNVKKIAVR